MGNKFQYFILSKQFFFYDKVWKMSLNNQYKTFGKKTAKRNRICILKEINKKWFRCGLTQVYIYWDVCTRHKLIHIHGIRDSLWICACHTFQTEWWGGISSSHYIWLYLPCQYNAVAVLWHIWHGVWLWVHNNEASPAPWICTYHSGGCQAAREWTVLK